MGGNGRFEGEQLQYLVLSLAKEYGLVAYCDVHDEYFSNGEGDDDALADIRRRHAEGDPAVDGAPLEHLLSLVSEILGVSSCSSCEYEYDHG